MVDCDSAVVLPPELSAETTGICAEGVTSESLAISVCLFWERMSPSPFHRSPPGTVLERPAALHSGPVKPEKLPELPPVEEWQKI